MRSLYGKKSVLRACHIYRTLKTHTRGKHISFHTPGHKAGKWDITELAYSDNLSAPKGCILQAEKDIATILGAEKSFILTDGSTSGVFSMLFAVKKLGAKCVLTSCNSHKSVFNACAVLGLNVLTFENTSAERIPLPITEHALGENFEKADAVLLTCPDYYGNIADLSAIAARCQKANKMLLIDGAHGGHLHFQKEIYAGSYADFWVDGVHKSLPALTQGAVVSAKSKAGVEALYQGVQYFRTTSPSYPIMASVEYAVKYPRNIKMETRVRAFAEKFQDRVYLGKDWTKFCVRFGKHAFEVEKALQKKGIYAEFCDGNVIVFYLSPATKTREWKALIKTLSRLFLLFPYVPQKELERIPAPPVFNKNATSEWLGIDECTGKICAGDCGLFPPCTPLVRKGERIEQEKLNLIKKADNAYGVWENKILVYKEEENAR